MKTRLKLYLCGITTGLGLGLFFGEVLLSGHPPRPLPYISGLLLMSLGSLIYRILAKHTDELG